MIIRRRLLVHLRGLQLDRQGSRRARPPQPGLILIHDDVELFDTDARSKGGRRFRAADILGVIGGVGLNRSMDWAAPGDSSGGRSTIVAIHGTRISPRPGAATRSTESFSGLSPRACRELRSTRTASRVPRLRRRHCAQARRGPTGGAGRRSSCATTTVARKTDLVAYRQAECGGWRNGVPPCVPVRRRRKRWPTRLVRGAGRRVIRPRRRAGARESGPDGGSPGHDGSAPPGPPA